jgi:protein SCO1/2
LTWNPAKFIKFTLMKFFRALATSSCLLLTLLSAQFSLAEEIPNELKGVGFTEHLGSPVSIDEIHFKNETGQDVALSTYFRRGKPVILAMVYYGCPNLCNFMLNGLTQTLKNLDWTAGERFDIVTVSINPKETPDLAAKKKAAYVESYGRKQSAPGWHFLTGEESQIEKLASQVGFGYRYDEREKQYAHGSAIYVLTPEGKISRYLYGIDFRPQDLRLSLLEASSGKIGSVVDRFLLFCYHYDPQTRRYSVVVNRVMETGCGGTVLFFGGYLTVFWRREKKKKGPDLHV